MISQWLSNIWNAQKLGRKLKSLQHMHDENIKQYKSITFSLQEEIKRKKNEIDKLNKQICNTQRINFDLRTEIEDLNRKVQKLEYFEG